MTRKLQGQILKQVNQKVVQKINRKPCPYCLSPKVYKRGE